MPSVIGIDTKKFARRGLKGNFLALTGIGIQVKNYLYFKNKYSEIMTDLLNKNDIVVDKKIFKSYDLLKFGLELDFFQEFFDKIKNEIEKLSFFYSYFPHKISGENKKQKIAPREEPIRFKIKIFPYDMPKEITSIEFLSQHLHNSFPHVCAWELCENGFDGTIYIDDFSGKITNAWKSIEKNEKIFVLPNGDKSNALISTADILLTFLDRKMFFEKKFLKEEDIKPIFNDFEDKIETFFISSACLYHIRPLSSRIEIPKYQKLLHPVFYIVNERSKFISKKMIERSPLSNIIINTSFEKNGCFKLFDFDLDHNHLTVDDYLVFFGEEGKKFIEHLKNLGYPFKTTSFTDLVKK